MPYGSSISRATNSLAAPAAVTTEGTSTLRFKADQRMRALTLGAGTTLATGGHDLTVEGRLDAAGTLEGSGDIRLEGNRAHSITGTSRNYTGWRWQKSSLVTRKQNSPLV